MYITEIIVEGFKSYAQRTVIAGFDPAFNAITGLNGSGKSNILDSICFVLGISNLSQVRATNLQELVYKQGQAGVTKASVSIVFNNEDPSKSPIGYEQHRQITVTRQIVIGGRNKCVLPLPVPWNPLVGRSRCSVSHHHPAVARRVARASSSARPICRRRCAPPTRVLGRWTSVGGPAPSLIALPDDDAATNRRTNEAGVMTALLAPRLLPPLLWAPRLLAPGTS